MHNFTLFSREIEWNQKCFHFFREMKSETNYPFTLFEKWKVKWFFVSLFSRSESEIEIPRDRDREVKFQNNSREFSRNETLAGYCPADDKIMTNHEWRMYTQWQPSCTACRLESWMIHSTHPEQYQWLNYNHAVFWESEYFSRYMIWGGVFGNRMSHTS